MLHKLFYVCEPVSVTVCKPCVYVLDSTYRVSCNLVFLSLASQLSMIVSVYPYCCKWLSNIPLCGSSGGSDGKRMQCGRPGSSTGGSSLEKAANHSPDASPLSKSHEWRSLVSMGCKLDATDDFIFFSSLSIHLLTWAHLVLHVLATVNMPNRPWRCTVTFQYGFLWIPAQVWIAVSCSIYFSF